MLTSHCSPSNRAIRRTSVLATLAFVATVGCREGSIAPPSGLVTTLSMTNAVAPYPPPTVQAAADSVVATYVSGVTGCDDYRAEAGMRGGIMILTVTAMPGPDRPCLTVLASAVYRVALHGAPAGQYPVIVVMRWLEADGKRGPSSVIVRGVITLP